MAIDYNIATILMQMTLNLVFGDMINRLGVHTLVWGVCFDSGGLFILKGDKDGFLDGKLWQITNICNSYRLLKQLLMQLLHRCQKITSIKEI